MAAITFETLVYSPFISACEANDIKAIQNLLTRGYYIDEVDSNGMTGLMIAAAAGYTNIIKALLLYGADFTIKDRKEMNAVDHATDEEIISILSRTAINLDIKSVYIPESNTFMIEVWHLYKLVHQKSYVNDNFENLFSDVSDLYPSNNTILWYNRTRLTPLNKEILTCTTETQIVNTKPTNWVLSRILGCVQLC